MFQENCYKSLERKIDDGEKYQRRRSLRINGIAGDNSKLGSDCLTEVNDEVRKLGVNVADCEYDRAHRVGRKTDARGNVVDCRQMVVRFTTWRTRTEVYRSRDKHSDIRFYIDQTKRRFNLRKWLSNLWKINPRWILFLWTQTVFSVYGSKTIPTNSSIRRMNWTIYSEHYTSCFETFNSFVYIFYFLFFFKKKICRLNSVLMTSCYRFFLSYFGFLNSLFFKIYAPLRIDTINICTTSHRYHRYMHHLA